MAQHDYVIDNSTGANVRADINNVLQAIATNNSGSSAPSTTVATQFFADTSAGIMKLRNTANSGYVNLFTLAGGIDVDAASNFNEDVTFTGATSGRNIVFDKSDNALEFLDNSVCKFGTDGDGDIFHDGSDLFIRETDSGQLLFRADGQHVFANSAGSENRILTVNNGAVQLFFDHSKKFETQTNGVTVTGNIFADTANARDIGSSSVPFNDAFLNGITMLDSKKIALGSSADLQIYHDGTHSRVVDNGTGNLILQGSIVNMQNVAGTENMVKATQNNGVELFYDNATILETESWGVMVTGTVEADQFNLLDSNGTTQQIRIGASGDMRLFHQSSENIIGVNTVGQDIFFKSSSSSALDTTSFVVRTDGSVTHPDNIKLKFGTSDDFEIFHQSSFPRNVIESNSCDLLFLTSDAAGTAEKGAAIVKDGQVELYFDNTERFATKSDGALLSGKYRQKSSGGNIVYAKQVFRESIAANATKTFTITGMAYGNVKLTMGFGDGNFHYATFAAVLGGNMYSVGNAYAAAQLLNDRSGVNSITVTKSNSSYAVAIHAGTNQIFGSVVVESNGYDTHSGVTLTIS